MKKSRFLLTKYIILIILAIILIPAILTIGSLIYNKLLTVYSNDYYNPDNIHHLWNEASKKLKNQNPDRIRREFSVIKKSYPESSMFWVDKAGITQDTVSLKYELPNDWNASDMIHFLKGYISNENYIEIAYLDNNNEAFMAFIIPSQYIIPPMSRYETLNKYLVLVGILLPIVLLIIVSLIFFNNIRRRIVKLQKAMYFTHDDKIPSPINILKRDEIGLLELSFNHMVKALRNSKIKEKEEENIRKRLIADISHDLRTPLTTIRAQLSSLHKERLTDRGRETINNINNKIDFLSDLMDNLLSYSLLSSKRYPTIVNEVDIVRLIRNIVANWYDVLEENQFDIDINIPSKSIIWTVDTNWLERMINNVIQNVIRHAGKGKYISINIINKENQDVLLIVDRGPGLDNISENKGAGLGLSIVELMADQMDMKFDIYSTSIGCTCSLRMKEN
jgi:signal transduction histidine kinase